MDMVAGSHICKATSVYIKSIELSNRILTLCGLKQRKLTHATWWPLTQIKHQMLAMRNYREISCIKTLNRKFKELLDGH